MKYRYLVFNEKTKEVYRVDSIEKSVVLLPENHGILLPNGLIKQSGGFIKFEVAVENVVYQGKKVSINGEDFEYIYYNLDTGEYFLYTYNIIKQEANPPLIANGYAHFDNGHLAVFKADSEPKRNHTLQIWDTSFSIYEKALNLELEGTFLYNLGNKTIVSAIADLSALLKLIEKEDSYYGLYVDIVNDVDSIINSYFWLDKPEGYNLKNDLLGIKDAAAVAIKEFEKINKIKELTKKQSAEVEEKTLSILKTIKYTSFSKLNDYISSLSQLRKLRGEIANLKDLQFVDLAKVETLSKNLKDENERLSEACVEYLLQDKSLEPYMLSVEECKKGLDTIEKVIDGKNLEEKIINISEELELLINIVNNLKISDTTKSSEIIDKISELFSHLNQTKSALVNIVDNLDIKEKKSEFYSKLNLITQSISNYLNLCTSFEKVDSYLTKLMVQLDELESKFSDFDEFVVQLTEKREEIVSTFTTKKQQLLEKRNKKINSLGDAGNRVLKGLENRLNALESITEINEVFSSDLMIEKIRDIIDNLISLGDATKASEIESNLKSLKENTIRQLKDKKELFLDGNTIKFGNNNFLVSDEKTELTILKKDDYYYFHISGTDFWEKIDDEKLYKYKNVWNQEIVSESPTIYRAEYLAYNLYLGYKEKNDLTTLNQMSEEQLKNLIKNYVENNYNEYYIRGVHDIDALIILKEILNIEHEISLIIYKAEDRAFAKLFWECGLEEEERKSIFNKLKSLNMIAKYTKKNLVEGVIPLLVEKLELFVKKHYWLVGKNLHKTAEYLAKEIIGFDNFALSKEAHELYIEFNSFLTSKNANGDFKLSLENLKDDFEGKILLVSEWIKSFAYEKNIEPTPFLEELKILCFFQDFEKRRLIKEKAVLKVSGLVGVHQNISNGGYQTNYIDFIEKVEDFIKNNIKAFYEFQELKSSLIYNMKKKIKFDELKANVLTSFVRNKLIDQVYLPLIGDNFAKQIGVAGKNKRTDNMGMLLMISPPGYGKTTLVEYIASRLNMLLVKINCPTIGHQVTSLDPSQAGNANAREELEKLNLAFELGNNVIIYLDDIQHSNPEFLQKFISLCDGQRKIDGIWKGQSKTYQFKGKKVAVIMAGNPYTESGDKFQIPDMLSNRADVYNLGDMLRENEEAFKLSYLENAMTSNPYLNKLYMRNQEDTYKIINSIKNNDTDNLELSENYTESDIAEYISVLKNMIKVRDNILKVNMEYIHSAAQNEKYRTEPAFKLQGSYRNMNKISEKIVPVMNDSELENLILKTYENDAQTLASDAESSLLKFKEITNKLDENNKKRWEEIKRIFLDEKQSKDGDNVVKVIEELSKIGINLKLLGESFLQKIKK